MFETYLIYNSIVIFSTLFVYISDKVSKRSVRFCLLFISFLIIFVPAATRYNIGSDYWSYVEIFNNYLHGGYAHVETGNKYIINLIDFMGLGPHWFFVVTSFFIYLLYYLALPERKAVFFHLSYMLFYYLTTYNLVRSALVFSICLLIVKLLISDKKSNFFIISFLILLGLNFHKSIVLIIPFVLMVWMRVDIHFNSVALRNLFICLIAISFLTGGDILRIIISSGVINWVGYGYYINTSFFSETEFGSGIGFLLNLIIFSLPIVFWKKSSRDGNSLNSVVISTTILLLITSVFSATIDIFSRVQKFFLFGILFFPSYFLSFAGSVKRKISLIIYFLIAFIIFEGSIYKMRSDNCAGARISPYVSIFNIEDDKSLSGITVHECKY